LEATDETGATPLHIAATQCKPQTISWLLKHRADIGARDGDGFSALTWACVKGHCDAVKLLLQGKADIQEVTDSNGKTPLTLSAERGNLECVTELLSKRASLEQSEKMGGCALMCAAHHNETEVVSYLLGNNANVNFLDADGWSALMYSVNTPMPPRAAGAGGEQTEKKMNIDGVLGKKSTTELLLLHKADVNAQTQDGLTALIVAASRNRPTAVRRLIECKAEVNLTSSREQSALLMGAAHDSPEVVRVLIMANADVNHLNSGKESALSLAEKYSSKEVVELLIKAGAIVPKVKGKKGGKKKK